MGKLLHMLLNLTPSKLIWLKHFREQNIRIELPDAWLLFVKGKEEPKSS